MKNLTRLNTEYTIIPILLPDNPADYIKVCSFPISIPTRDDETGNLVNTMEKEQEWIKKVSEAYRWKGKGKTTFVYGASTAGGIGNRKQADKVNQKLIEKLQQFTTKEFYNSKF
jgi:hypothetical protein